MLTILASGNPLSFLSDLLDVRSLLQTALAIIPALVFQEAAHAYAAWRLGDPTAKKMGRLTLNPLRHLDPVGTLMLFVAHIGWAKPVPVNPYYFKNRRRDDLIVSLAGITANLIMFLIGCVLMYGSLGLVMSRATTYRGYYHIVEGGETYRADAAFMLRYAYAMGSYFITPQCGAVWGFLYETLTGFVTLNLSLALFNLIPMPPLDGYHVLNDLILKQPLFASREVAQIGQIVLLVASFTGYLGKGLTYLLSGAMTGIGNAAVWAAGLFGLI